MKMGKEKVKLHRHHRKCRSNGGSNHVTNISMVKSGKHESWHHLFKNFTAFKIAEIINEKWLDPDFKLIVVSAYTGERMDENGS